MKEAKTLCEAMNRDEMKCSTHKELVYDTGGKEQETSGWKQRAFLYVSLPFPWKSKWLNSSSNS